LRAQRRPPVASNVQPLYDVRRRPASDRGKIGTAMKFGQRIRQLRQSKGWTLRDLAAKVEVGFTYLSKVENEKLDGVLVQSLPRSRRALLSAK
jgi:ribosome-binding protein aMBF1 (putative translation factor)